MNSRRLCYKPWFTKGKPLFLHLCVPVGQSQVKLCCHNLLEEMSVVKTYPIYLHCFSYTGWDFGMWFSRFDECVIWLVPKVISDPNPGLHEVIRDINPHRYILEMDGPCFCTPGYPYGAPDQIYKIHSLCPMPLPVHRIEELTVNTLFLCWLLTILCASTSLRGESPMGCFPLKRGGVWCT